MGRLYVHMQVRTNMEDFDMEAEEAVKAAVEEFTLQNYDLGNVVKTAAGKELAKCVVLRLPATGRLMKIVLLSRLHKQH